jgi:hypothetical protein
MFRAPTRTLGFVLLAFCLSSCGHQQAQSPQVAVKPPVVKPANPNDIKAWNAYLADAPRPQLEGIVNNPYKFLVPSGDDPAARDRRKMVEGALTSMASSNSFPGTVITVGGPDPVKTADVLVAAFGKARPDSLKALILVYIGDEANRARVQKVVAASGAELRFTGM